MNFRRVRLMSVAVLVGIEFTARTVAPLNGVEPEAPADGAAAVLPHLQALFDDGYAASAGKGKLESAAKSFDAARRLSPHDPRVDHAWGLVLLKRSDRKGAGRQFAAAIEQTEEPWWPAWQVQVGMLLAEREKQIEGLNRLSEFAQALGKSADGTPVSDEQFDAARWIGQALAALDHTVPARPAAKSGTKPHLRDLLEATEERIEQVLDDELLSAAEVGRQFVRVRAAELEHDAAEKGKALADRQARKKKDEAKKIAGDLSDLAQEKVNAVRAKEEMNKKLNDLLDKADKELERLEKAFQAVEQERLRLDQRLMQLMQQLTLMESAAGGVGPGYSTNTFGNPAQRYTQLRIDYGNSHLRYLAAIDQRQQIAQQAEMIARERNLAMAKHQQETGNVEKRAGDLDKWTDRLNAKVKELDALPPEGEPVKDSAKGKAKRVAPKSATTDRKAPLTFRSYVPLDFDAEKSRVLDSYRTPTGAADSAPRDGSE